MLTRCPVGRRRRHRGLGRRDRLRGSCRRSRFRRRSLSCGPLPPGGFERLARALCPSGHRPECDRGPQMTSDVPTMTGGSATPSSTSRPDAQRSPETSLNGADPVPRMDGPRRDAQAARKTENTMALVARTGIVVWNKWQRTAISPSARRGRHSVASPLTGRSSARESSFWAVSSRYSKGVGLSFHLPHHVCCMG